MEWAGSTKAVFCLVVFLQMSCHQWKVNAAPLPPCVDQELAITADNKLRLYIDGVEVTDLQHENAAPQADFVPLPASTQVIAASGQENGKDSGILGSTGTFVTDSSWKCIDQYREGWQGVAFDDSAWEAAYEVRQHGEQRHQDVEGIREDAYWIWVDSNGRNDGQDVYCRKSLVGTCISAPTGQPTEATTQEPTEVPTTTTTTTQEPTEVPTTTTTTTQEPTEVSTTTTATTTTTQKPTSPTNPSCSGTGTGPTCITTCSSRVDGDYQSCKGCHFYARCSDGILNDEIPCPASGLYWDDSVKHCDSESTTCSTCHETPPTATPATKPTVEPTTEASSESTDAPTEPHPQPTSCSGTGTGPTCITSCYDRVDGDYQSCKGCHFYARCSDGILDDGIPCPASGLYWDDSVKSCERESTTCRTCHETQPTGPPSTKPTDPPTEASSGPNNSPTQPQTTTTQGPSDAPTSPTIPPCSGTGPTCITSCNGRANGDYQSCNGCQVFATCSNEILTDDRPCASGGTYWDDNVKRCEWESTTCRTCHGTQPTGPPSTKPTEPNNSPTEPHPQPTTTQGPSDAPTSPPCSGTGPTCITSCNGRANGDYQSCNGCQVYASCSNGILTDDRPCASGGTFWDDIVKGCEWDSATCQECIFRRIPL